MSGMAGTTDILLYIAIGEFLLLIILFAASTFFLFFKKRKQDTRATHNLINKIQAGKAKRADDLSNVLEKVYNIRGDEVHAQAQKLIRLENQFYQKFIRTYLTRDANAIEIIDDELKHILDNYTQLANSTSPETGAEQVIEYIEMIEKDGLGEENEASSEKITSLKNSIQQVNEELKLYRITLNRLFFEYANIFGVDVDPRNQLSAKEVLRRLESGQLADHEAPDEPHTQENPEKAKHTEVEHPQNPLEKSVSNTSSPKPLTVIEQEADVAELIKAENPPEALVEIEAEEKAEIDAFEKELAQILESNKDI
jgi:hypothetical protein